MDRCDKPRVRVESRDPRFRAFSLIALEAFGDFVVEFVDPRPDRLRSAPPPSLLLLDRRSSQLPKEWETERPLDGSAKPSLAIVLVTDQPEHPSMIPPLNSRRPVHVLEDSGDPKDLCDEVTRILEFHRTAFRFN